jgi:hypothetical protein
MIVSFRKTTPLNKMSLLSNQIRTLRKKLQQIEILEAKQLASHQQVVIFSLTKTLTNKLILFLYQKRHHGVSVRPNTRTSGFSIPPHGGAPEANGDVKDNMPNQWFRPEIDAPCPP